MDVGPTGNFPKNLLEFEDRFGTEAACLEYLIALRWPDGFRCAACGHDRAWRTARPGLRCSRCQREVAMLAGTVLEGTRKPLRWWFRAMWWVVTQKRGLSAKGFAREMGLSSYTTAWTWLHKLRRCMVRAGRESLSGRVEVDETYIGGEEAGRRGRWIEDKALVVIAAEEDGTGIGRIRLAHIADASAASLVPFVVDAVAPGSVVHTDGWRGYAGLAAKGFTHEVSIIAPDPHRAAALLPRVHRVASLLKRWLLGTHQGAVSNKHLQRYLDEYTFRFNRAARVIRVRSSSVLPSRSSLRSGQHTGRSSIHSGHHNRLGPVEHYSRQVDTPILLMALRARRSGAG